MFSRIAKRREFAVSSKGGSGSNDLAYALVTAARNEEKHIGAVLESVERQTVKPHSWIVVSDCSSDSTDEIVSEFARFHDYTQLLRVNDKKGRNFASQAHSLNAGIARLRANATWSEYKYIGTLDADITLESDYYASVLQKFSEDTSLGICGGFIHEKRNGKYYSRRFNTDRSVAGAVQMFRKECLESIGLFLPLPYGGLDTYAELRARWRGYTVRSFEDIKAYHHRRTGGGQNWYLSELNRGRMEYTLGYHPAYEILSCVRRVADRPWGIGALVKLAGYGCALFYGEDVKIPRDMSAFLRREQIKRVSTLLGFRKGKNKRLTI